jgi:polysaccharide biosynthesis protein PslG
LSGWRAALLATVTAALAFASGAAWPGGARAAELGVVTDINWWIPYADQVKSWEAMNDLGGQWTRIHVQWRQVESFPDVYDQWQLANLDNAVDRSRAAGANVILMVYNAPSWASGSDASNVPRDPATFARFVGVLARRYMGRVAAYEIWNEENYRRFWSTGPDPEAYARLLRSSYVSIKAVDPSAKIVFGGLSTADYRFVEAAYDAGAKGSFDVMAVHPYTYCGTSGPSEIRRGSNGRITRDSFLGYREVRASMLARGDDKPIWLTELGWNTSSEPCNPAAGMWQGGVSEKTQARYLSQAFRLIDGDAYVEVAIVYDIRNGVGDADTPEAQYGLLHRDYSPKPAYDAFKRYAARQAATSYAHVRDLVLTARKRGRQG